MPSLPKRRSVTAPFFFPGDFIEVVKVTQSCLTLCDPVDCSLPGSSVLEILQAGTLEWVSQSLLHGIVPTQGSNPGLLPCRWILYPLSHQGRNSRLCQQKKKI